MRAARDAQRGPSLPLEPSSSFSLRLSSHILTRPCSDTARRRQVGRDQLRPRLGHVAHPLADLVCACARLLDRPNAHLDRRRTEPDDGRRCRRRRCDGGGAGGRRAREQALSASVVLPRRLFPPRRSLCPSPPFVRLPSLARANCVIEICAILCRGARRQAREVRARALFRLFGHLSHDARGKLGRRLAQALAERASLPLSERKRSQHSSSSPGSGRPQQLAPALRRGGRLLLAVLPRLSTAELGRDGCYDLSRASMYRPRTARQRALRPPLSSSPRSRTSSISLARRGRGR